MLYQVLSDFQHGPGLYKTGTMADFHPAIGSMLQKRGLLTDRLPSEPINVHNLVVCIASGPSLTAEDIAAVRSLHSAGLCTVIVTNATFRAVPWADVLCGQDAGFWRGYADEIRAVFPGRKVCPHPTPLSELQPISALNSGAMAIKLAVKMGAKRIILLGYDGQHTGGRAHHHADHPRGMGNAGAVRNWPGQFSALAADLPASVEVVNATRETAVTAWRRAPLSECLTAGTTPVRIAGMGGMGDCLHQRAIVRRYMQSHCVTLETPWPELYHDLRGPRLALVPMRTNLRTQLKNQRASRGFDKDMVNKGAPTVRVHYPPAAVREHRGVLPAMAAQCAAVGASDFSLPVPSEWRHGLDLPTDRPVIVYRPLVERKEWGGCATRNPDAAAYVETLRALRDRLGAYVVSVADVVEGQEWIVSDPVGADLELHAGELGITRLCALWRDAGLIYSAPGFGLIMAQAVGTPVVSLFGGYERAYSFRDDAKTCKIEPENPCDCFRHGHGCGKRMDTARAIQTALAFVEEVGLCTT